MPAYFFIALSVNILRKTVPLDEESMFFLSVYLDSLDTYRTPLLPVLKHADGFSRCSAGVNIATLKNQTLNPTAGAGGGEGWEIVLIWHSHLRSGTETGSTPKGTAIETNKGLNLFSAPILLTKRSSPAILQVWSLILIVHCNSPPPLSSFVPHNYFHFFSVLCIYLNVVIYAFYLQMTLKQKKNVGNW